MRALTPRQERFLELYLDGPNRTHSNATKCAGLAGYRWPGKQGPRLLTMPPVAARVDAWWKAFDARERRAEARRIAHCLAMHPGSGHRRACREK